MRLVIIIAMLLLMICSGCPKDGAVITVTETESSELIEEIERSGQLRGVREVRLDNDASVVLVDSKPTVNVVNLIMLDASNNRVDTVNLKVGQACMMTDFRHMFITYKLLDIKEDQLTFQVTDKFNAVSFGDGITIAQKTFTISPYKK